MSDKTWKWKTNTSEPVDAQGQKDQTGLERDLRIGMIASELCRKLNVEDRRGWYWNSFIEILEKYWRVGGSPARSEETRYLKLLRWFKLFYDFYQKDIAGKPSACASALSEDTELQEFVNESRRID